MKLDMDGETATPPVVATSSPYVNYPTFEHEVGVTSTRDDAPSVVTRKPPVVTGGRSPPSWAKIVDSGVPDTVVDLNASCSVNVTHATDPVKVVKAMRGTSLDKSMPAVEEV